MAFNSRQYCSRSLLKLGNLKIAGGLLKLAAGIAITLTSLTACGGGGGGGDSFIGAANVSMRVSPNRIDTADRMLVTVELSEVNESGIALKFKVPQGLRYVLASSSLTADSKSFDISPAVNVEEGNFRYIVYYLSQSSFGKGKNGKVEFFLEGIRRVVQGAIEVDADVDNPLVDNSTEFDPKNPDFAAEDSVEVTVEG